MELNLKLRIVGGKTEDKIFNLIRTLSINEESVKLFGVEFKPTFIQTENYMETATVECTELVKLEQPPKTKTEYILTDFDTVGQAVQCVYDISGAYFYKSSKDGDWLEASYAFAGKLWQDNTLYKKVVSPIDWWDNIQEGGVLCIVKDYEKEEEGTLQIVVGKEYGKFNTVHNVLWHYATPLTKEEIEVYLGNVPDK